MTFTKCWFTFLISIPLSILGVLTPVFAQKKLNKAINEQYTRTRTVLEPMPIHISAIGSLDFYGLRLGLDYPFRIIEQRGFKTSAKGKRRVIEQYISTDFGFLHKENAFDNLSFSLEYTARIINGNGYFYQLSPLGIGVSYPIKPLFQLQNKTQTDTTLPTNRFYATPSVSVGFGRDLAFLRGKRGQPMAIYAKIGCAVLLPHKKWGYLLPFGEVSFAYRFQGLTTFVKRVRRD